MIIVAAVIILIALLIFEQKVVIPWQRYWDRKTTAMKYKMNKKYTGSWKG